MKGWNELGVVGTIYEEEEEEEDDQDDDDNDEEEEEEERKYLSLTPSLTTSPISPTSSSSLPSTPLSLHSRVEEWRMATGCNTDVVIRIHNQCFNLHKDPLISRSRYLRRCLTESNDITVTPPSIITAETLTEVFLFCYDSVINLTPSNLAAVRVAAEWLEMDRDDVSGSLTWETEAYFRREVAGDAWNAGHVLRECLGMMPDRTAALIAVRCVEVLAGRGAEGGWTEELTALGVGEFRVIAEVMRTWFVRDHDLLYWAVDHYFEKHKEKLREDDKASISSTINCTKLSHHLLIHLVRNPRLPLRFIVQATLFHHLHTRNSLFLPLSSPSSTPTTPHPLTLASVLQRDSLHCHASRIRAFMEATENRIDSLQRDLEDMRRKLRWTEEKRTQMEPVRSSSFRVVRRLDEEEEDEEEEVVSNSSCVVLGKSSGRCLRKRLMDGLKSVFKTTSQSKGGEARGGGGRRPVEHRKNCSFA